MPYIFYYATNEERHSKDVHRHVVWNKIVYAASLNSELKSDFLAFLFHATFFINLVSIWIQRNHAIERWWSVQCTGTKSNRQKLFYWIQNPKSQHINRICQLDILSVWYSVNCIIKAPAGTYLDICLILHHSKQPIICWKCIIINRLGLTGP